MDVVCALVGVHHFQIHHVPDDAKFVADAVAAQHVACRAGNVQGFAATVALHDAGGLDAGGAGVFHASELQAALQAQADVGQHVSELLLHQLIGRQWAAKLLALHGVLAGPGKAVFGGTQGAPGNAVACAVQAGERAFQSAHIGQGVFFGAEHVVHHDLARDAGAQADFAVDRRCAQTLGAFVQNEATDLPAVVLGPDQKHVGDGRVADPHLGAAQAVATGHGLGSGDHAAGVTAMVGLGQTKAANPFASGEFGQVFLLLCFAAKLVDGHHHQ